MKKTALALAVTTGLTGLVIATPAQAATVDTVATADSFVDARYKSTNYGDDAVFKVDGRAAQLKYAYLKFAVPTVRAGEEIDTVTLRLRSQVSSARGISVYGTGPGWAEGALKWSNQPDGRTLLGSSDALTSGTTEVIGLKPGNVTPGQMLNLRVETSALAALSFVSNDGLAARRPILRVTTSAVTPPVVTPPPVTPPPVTPPPVTPPPVTPPPVTPPPVTPPPVTPPPVTPPPVTPPPVTPPPVTPPPSTNFPPAMPILSKVIGMSAPVDKWDQRIAEVGSAGIKSRRIFADLSASGSSQLPLIRQAIADGMIPVISYKVPNPATMSSGGYDAWMATLKSQLNGLGAPVTATYWHEPHGDMTPAEFRAGSQRFLDGVKSPKIAVGPILNGWLLDNLKATNRANFHEYTSPALLAAWDFVGVDSYHAGTEAAPNNALLPARAVPQVAAWLDGQGFPDKRIVLGEYNGFTAAAIQQAGEWILSTPELWIGNVWNTDHSTFSALSGDRITAFKATKSDVRAVR